MGAAVEKNEEKSLPGGCTGKGWMPGKSGNPGGRPKGLARRIREEVPEGDLVEFQRALLYLLPELLTKWRINPKDVRLTDRMGALTWLTERGHGKAPSYAPLEGDPLQLDDIDAAIASVVDELAPRREAAAVREAS